MPILDEEELAEFIDERIQYSVEDAVENYIAYGKPIPVDADIDALIERIEKVERELREQNYWKADRNHSHTEK